MRYHFIKSEISSPRCEDRGFKSVVYSHRFQLEWKMTWKCPLVLGLHGAGKVSLPMNSMRRKRQTSLRHWRGAKPGELFENETPGYIVLGYILFWDRNHRICSWIDWGHSPLVSVLHGYPSRGIDTRYHLGGLSGFTHSRGGNGSKLSEWYWLLKGEIPVNDAWPATSFQPFQDVESPFTFYKFSRIVP